MVAQPDSYRPANQNTGVPPEQDANQAEGKIQQAVVVPDVSVFMPEDIFKLLMGVAGIRQQDGLSPKSNDTRRENPWGESHPQARYAVLPAKPLYFIIFLL